MGADRSKSTCLLVAVTSVAAYRGGARRETVGRRTGRYSGVTTYPFPGQCSQLSKIVRDDWVSRTCALRRRLLRTRTPDPGTTRVRDVAETWCVRERWGRRVRDHPLKRGPFGTSRSAIATRPVSSATKSWSSSSMRSSGPFLARTGIPGPRTTLADAADPSSSQVGTSTTSAPPGLRENGRIVQDCGRSRVTHEDRCRPISEILHHPPRDHSRPNQSDPDGSETCATSPEVCEIRTAGL